MEEYVHNHLKTLSEPIAEFNKIGGFKKPESFIVTNVDTDRSHYIPVDLSAFGEQSMGAFYSDRDHSGLITLSDLIEISKKSATKFRCNAFMGDQFKKFLAKSKSLNAKITGVDVFF